MRVVRTHDVPDHFGALVPRSIGQQPLVVHRVEDPPVYGLQPVPHVGQRPRHDDRHRILEEGALHLLLDLDGLDEPRHVLVGAGAPRSVVVTSWHSLSLSCSLALLCSLGYRTGYGYPTGRPATGGPCPQMSRKRTSLALVWMN